MQFNFQQENFYTIWNIFEDINEKWWFICKSNKFYLLKYNLFKLLINCRLAGKSIKK